MQHDFFNELSGYVQKRLNSYALQFDNSACGLTIHAENKDIFNIISFFHHDTYCQFESVINMFVIQNMPQKPHLVYVLISYEKKVSLRISIPVSPYIASISDLYKSAIWLERQLWEDTGIIFTGHRDLRHLFRRPTLNTLPTSVVPHD